MQQARTRYLALYKELKKSAYAWYDVKVLEHKYNNKTRGRTSKVCCLLLRIYDIALNIIKQITIKGFEY